jgi:ABC-type branched-subunit amino acid transport system ATPase component
MSENWSNDPELRVEHLTMRFGGLTAIGDLSFDAGRRQITALIGPNGAGKTTVFNCIILQTDRRHDRPPPPGGARIPAGTHG